MKIHKEQKVVCICRGGQVRSVAARYILADHFGFRKVLACGWEKNDEETVRMLCEWADVVLVVGSADSWVLNSSLVPPPNKTVLINIGEDRWGRYNHPDLVGVLRPKIEELL